MFQSWYLCNITSYIQGVEIDHHYIYTDKVDRRDWKRSFYHIVCARTLMKDSEFSHVPPIPYNKLCDGNCLWFGYSRFW